MELADGKLLDGFGVEDIAVWLSCTPGAVRKYVSALRKSGRFQQWWGAT